MRTERQSESGANEAGRSGQGYRYLGRDILAALLLTLAAMLFIGIAWTNAADPRRAGAATVTPVQSLSQN